METQTTTASPVNPINRRYSVGIVLKREIASFQTELTLCMSILEARSKDEAIGLATRQALASNAWTARAISLIQALEIDPKE